MLKHAEDFEPEVPVKVNDRWEGEDEDDVKENWEDEEEEEKKDEGDGKNEEQNKPYQRKKKKLADRIAEKQAAKLIEEEANRILTPEEELAEKLKRQRLQEQSDLELAKEAFGASGKDSGGIDGMFPEDEESFNKFAEALKNKITLFEKSKFYSTFLEKLCTDLVVSLEAEDCRKLGQTLTNIYHEKQKQAKEQDKKKKKKTKITLKSERDNDFNDLAASSGGNYNYDDFDDDFI